MLPMTEANLRRVDRVVYRPSDGAFQLIISDELELYVSMSVYADESWAPGFFGCAFNTFLSMMKLWTGHRFVLETDVERPEFQVFIPAPRNPKP